MSMQTKKHFLSTARINTPLGEMVFIADDHKLYLTGGALGGYGAGVAGKQWLIEHEQKMAKNHGFESTWL